MTSYTDIFSEGGTTSGFDEIARLIGLPSSTTSIAGGKEETISILLNNKYFLKKLERGRKDFMAHHDNLRKYPKLQEEDWE